MGTYEALPGCVQPMTDVSPADNGAITPVVEFCLRTSERISMLVDVLAQATHRCVKSQSFCELDHCAKERYFCIHRANNAASKFKIKMFALFDSV
jgi:hypothetical protein